MSSDPRPSRAVARSCTVCAQRKVRCDKQYPCGRCKSAGVECVMPSAGAQPRWARRLARPPGSELEHTPAESLPTGMGVDSMLERLKNLERLVQSLGGELEHARAASAVVASTSPGSRPSNIPLTPAGTVGVATPQAGRFILDDSDRIRCVSSGFWSRIDHELDSLKQDTLGHEDEQPEGAFGGAQMSSKPSLSSAAEGDGALPDRYSLMSKSGASSLNYNASVLLPMASQIPFLLEVYTERVHSIIVVPHMPSLQKLLRHRRSQHMTTSPPSEDATMFAVFYAAICSLDDDEVTSSFNASRNELANKYHAGLEHALARADYLNNPSYDLVEALVIFLTLARRQDSPKYAWMMTGLVMRMANYLGLHHDGADFKHLTPFQIEMHRRLWWNICALDMRATEDQGTELALTPTGYSTKPPLNINDSDIWPEMEQPPSERQELANVSLFNLCSKVTRSAQEMMTTRAVATISDHYHRLSNLTQELERDYFSVTDESRDPIYGAVVGFMRIALGRMCLLSFFPVLFSSPSEDFSREIRTKSLIAAIEIAEHHHALNDRSSYQPWRWVYQTQTHWHAIVFILLEVCRRPWSPTIERAWLALQSPWLVPARASIDKNFNVWVPLRKLMPRARKHREDEILRLQADHSIAARVEEDDRQQLPVPSSSSTFPEYFDNEWFYERWRQLVRPVFGVTRPLDSMDHPSATDHSMANFDVYSGTSTTSSNTREGPLQTRAPAESTEPLNLDMFLSTDTDMGFLDDNDGGDLLDFNWNSWFESNRGAL